VEKRFMKMLRVMYFVASLGVLAAFGILIDQVSESLGRE
jgi:hypothetical protein